jgi:hypothetical protein
MCVTDLENLYIEVDQGLNRAVAPGRDCAIVLITIIIIHSEIEEKKGRIRLWGQAENAKLTTVYL